MALERGGRDKNKKKTGEEVIYGWPTEELFVAYKCILLMLTRYVALLTAVSTEHSFVGLCSILLLHRKRTAPTANTVHLLALVCPVSMGPIMGFRVNCSFRRRSKHYLQSKNNSVLRAPVGERVQRFCLPEVPSSSLALTYCFCIKKTALMAKYALFQLGLLWGFGLIAH